MAAVLGKVVYWLAVLAVSIALVIGLILWFEAQDESRIDGSGSAPGLTV
jgi:cytochrome b subunit of formate dehydrogenase